MNTIKFDFSSEIDLITLYIFADWHIGDRFCDLKSIINMISEVRENEKARVIIDGDLLNNATKDSVSDCYGETVSPNDQINMVVKMLEPIADKILFISPGNHEDRTRKKYGVDLMETIALRLGIEDRYGEDGGVIFLRFGHETEHGRKVRYSIYCTHGSGGGSKEGGKINRLTELSGIVDTDIYIHAHTHLPAIVKEDFFRVDNCNSCVQVVTKLFVNSSAKLNYGGYGQKMSMKPSCKDHPVIYLDGTKKGIRATL